MIESWAERVGNDRHAEAVGAALAQHAPDRIDELKPKAPRPRRERPAGEQSWF